jgi:hypothetical protein
MLAPVARYARRMGSIAVTFKHEGEADGEPVGPVYVYDEDESEQSWVGHLLDVTGPSGGWRKLSDARAWAASRGYAFYED